MGSLSSLRGGNQGRHTTSSQTAIQDLNPSQVPQSALTSAYLCCRLDTGHLLLCYQKHFSYECQFTKHIQGLIQPQTAKERLFRPGIAY